MRPLLPFSARSREPRRALPRYKAAGMQFMDAHGTRDVTEFLNVSKDDALAWPAVAHRTYPATVNAHMADTVIPFVEKSLTITHSIIDLFNDRLGLPEGTLAALHRPEEHSGCTARVIRAPPQVGREDKTFLTAHTDFGSLVSGLATSSRPRCPWA